MLSLVACGTDNKPTQQSATPAPDFKTYSAPIPFSGSWISAIYLKDITDAQSPRKAQESIEECYIQLPSNTLTPATMIINFHEGLSDLVTVINNGSYQLWEKQNDSLSRAVYTIEPLSADSLKIGDKIFVRIHPDVSGIQPRILEEILFKGNYQSKEGEAQYKDYAFGLGTQREHWASGVADMQQTLEHPDFFVKPSRRTAMATHDVHRIVAARRHHATSI